MHDLCPFGGILRAFCAFGVDQALQCNYKVKFTLFTRRIKVIDICEKSIACFAAAKPVERGVRQNTLKQHGQFAGRFVAVMLSQLHHAVLNDVERRLFFTDVVHAAFESAFFNAFQEVGEFLFSSQR